MPRILCCGSRKWDNPRLVYEVLSELPSDSVIIHGDESGADRYIKDAADRLCLSRIEISRQPLMIGSSASETPSQTAKMFTERPDLVIAFHKYLEKSRGTVQILKEAKERKIPIQLVS